MGLVKYLNQPVASETNKQTKKYNLNMDFQIQVIYFRNLSILVSNIDFDVSTRCIHLRLGRHDIDY